MTVSTFQQLKKNRNNFDALSKTLDNLNKKQSYADDRFWYPKKDKSGNGFAVIRFLDATAGEDVNFVSVYSHSFQGPGGKWFIENCPTTIGNSDCPVCAMNNQLWNSGIESDKKIVSARKRKLTYISNVYVVSDPQSPENEGKVFLFKYGKKIMDKIDDALNPEFPNDPRFNPFAFWTGKNGELPGADFQLKIRKVEGYSNYDKSEFGKPTEFLGGDDKQIETVWNQQHKLMEFVDPSKFKAAAELEKKLNFVLGRGVTNNAASAARVHESVDEAFPDGVIVDPDGDPMDMYRKLAEE